MNSQVNRRPANIPRHLTGSRTQSPFTDAPEHMRSLHYFWWEYLKRNREYRRWRVFSQDPRHMPFGLWGDILKADFPTWWKTRGSALFAEPIAVSHFPDEAPPGGHPGPYVWIKVPKYITINEAIDQLRNLLPRRIEPLPEGFGFATLRICGNVGLGSLYQNLKLYDLRLQYPHANLIEIYQAAGLPVNTPRDAQKDAHRRLEAAAKHINDASNLTWPTDIAAKTP